MMDTSCQETHDCASSGAQGSSSILIEDENTVMMDVSNANLQDLASTPEDGKLAEGRDDTSVAAEDGSENGDEKAETDFPDGDANNDQVYREHITEKWEDNLANDDDEWSSSTEESPMTPPPGMSVIKCVRSDAFKPRKSRKKSKKTSTPKRRRDLDTSESEDSDNPKAPPAKRRRRRRPKDLDISDVDDDKSLFGRVGNKTIPCRGPTRNKTVYVDYGAEGPLPSKFRMDDYWADQGKFCNPDQLRSGYFDWCDRELSAGEVAAIKDMHKRLDEWHKEIYGYEAEARVRRASPEGAKQVKEREEDRYRGKAQRTEALLELFWGNRHDARFPFAKEGGVHARGWKMKLENNQWYLEGSDVCKNETRKSLVFEHPYTKRERTENNMSLEDKRAYGVADTGYVKAAKTYLHDPLVVDEDGAELSGGGREGVAANACVLRLPGNS
ncbi:uncharacterized protein BDZ99DRAFT_182708 [Mytilinidion resinicola]|uniref:Uncharacterized protein n=1 Tax=Mytilinidion resinicola TaxID=574789 RepID=A0A6A6Z3D4_9PEZI|nr:uncharacterized protein BDZ99DRAFT_182708 [Mytilinidion resinicola]KAF2814675.1 hypothetical protein BDZ99DRAFT_182708 [Mytilinidion resinicola]